MKYSLFKRNYRFTKRGALIFVGVIAMGFITGGVAGLIHTDKISREYKPVTAKIEVIRKYKKRSRQNKRTTTVYDVTVSYQVDDQAYKTLLGSYSASMKTGDQMTIYYNPGKPTQISSVEINRQIWTIIMCVGVVLLLINCLVMPKIYKLAGL